MVHASLVAMHNCALLTIKCHLLQVFVTLSGASRCVHVRQVHLLGLKPEVAFLLRLSCVPLML